MKRVRSENEEDKREAVATGSNVCCGHTWFRLLKKELKKCKASKYIPAWNKAFACCRCALANNCTCACAPDSQASHLGMQRESYKDLDDL